MKAVVNFSTEPDSVEFREVPEPQAGSGEVIMEVDTVSVCGSDLHQWTGGHSWPVNYPVILGHEFAGRIAEIGSEVEGFAEGERVTSETAAVIDPDSPLTLEGNYHLDPNRKGFGYGVDGAMARYVKVPARCLHKVPDELPLEIAAVAEPCCVAYNAVVANGKVAKGERVLVLGPGPIGILCGLMAKVMGASEVAVAGLGRDAKRLATAESMGLLPLVGEVFSWSKQGDGAGVHMVVDAAGVSATLKTALEVVRPGGRIAKVGWGPQPLDFSLDPLVQKNVALLGSFSHNRPIWKAVLRLLASGVLDPSPILEGTWPLHDWREAFTLMHDGGITKAQLRPA
ncbi:MAG: Zn-dependent alcohol dehydrogenase [Opitutales bacterium]|nr:Zn-dependent alcohol dehydrogenase [Opitutales bacterium]|tara:strand:+ start:626 stop:1648 length:1023 start_codon:yes stop_codon:yes gene_type:complete